MRISSLPPIRLSSIHQTLSVPFLGRANRPELLMKVEGASCGVKDAERHQPLKNRDHTHVEGHNENQPDEAWDTRPKENEPCRSGKAEDDDSHGESHGSSLRPMLHFPGAYSLGIAVDL